MKPHTDYLYDENYEYNEEFVNGRAVTVLVYLSDVDKGGETSFPLGKATVDYAGRHQAYLDEPSNCFGHNLTTDRSEAEVEGLRESVAGKAPSKARLQPKRGSALIFWDMNPNFAKYDEASIHEGCPVIQGDKWSSTIWIHQDIGSPFEVFDELNRGYGLGIIPP